MTDEERAELDRVTKELQESRDIAARLWAARDETLRQSAAADAKIKTLSAELDRVTERLVDAEHGNDVWQQLDAVKTTDLTGARKAQCRAETMRDAALAQVAKLREACGAAIVEAAFVVETLWLSQQATPFEELAPSLVEQLPVAVAALRKAAVVLAETEPKP